MHRWIKYDLHMHSQYSKPYENEPGKVCEMSAKDFVEKLIEKQIDVFSITDHNCFNANYYAEIENYIKDKNISVIYGCEFNIYLDINKGDHFQANIYFSPESDKIKLENAIKEIYPTNNSRPFLDEIIDKLYKEELNFIIFPEADKSGGIRKIWHRIKENGQVDRFIKNGMQRIFKAYDTTDNFDKSSARQWALSYYKATKDFEKYIEKLTPEQVNVFTGNLSNYLKENGTSTYEYDEDVIKYGEIISKYGNCFTYFKFSDWHNGREYDPRFKNYIYGNDELPYESLELAVLDPVSRVNIIRSEEELSAPINYISEIGFNLNGEQQLIDFGEGLNAIVGKRASGKSLLMSVILELNKKDGEGLKKYKGYQKIDLDSIYCLTSDGQKLHRGQLDSLMYIEQNTITAIFENPTKAADEIKKYFVDLPEINYSAFDNLISNLKLVKKMNCDYKSMNSVIMYSHTMKHFVFKKHNRIDISEIKTAFEKLISDFNSAISNVKKVGLSTVELENNKRVTVKELKKIAKKLVLYNQIIDDLNNDIDIINDANDVSLERTRMARNSFDSSFKVLSDNFDALLAYKKTIYNIENFNLKLPNATSFKKGNYIFVSNYQLQSDDLKESIKECIVNQISKTRGSNQGMQLLKDYVFNPNVHLKANADNLYDLLEKKFISDNIKIIRTIFEEKNPIDISIMKNIEDFQNQVEYGNLDDISNSSLGRKSITYLELMLDSPANILLFDQPEDNIDNDYISNYFVPLIKNKKKSKQLIFITHNPSVAVYSDSFNYIFAFNDGKIRYENHYIESVDDKIKIINILDGGLPSFSNRNLKYGNVIGEFEHGTKIR